MHLDYENVPKQVREMRRTAARLRADWATTRAETEGSGDLKDIVLLLRRRGRISARRAMTLFVLLIAVVILGLLFYLGLPFWQQYVDGRRLTLTEQVSTITAQLAQIDTQVDEQIAELATALEGTVTVVETPTQARFRGHVPLSDGGLLFHGAGGALLRVNPDGTLPAEALIETPTQVSLVGHVPLSDGGLLFHGAGGALLRVNPDGTLPAEALIETPTQARFRGHVPLSDGGLLFYGEGGTLLRVNPDGTLPAEALIETPTQARLVGHVPLPDGGLLFYGEGGTMLLLSERSADDLRDRITALRTQFAEDGASGVEGAQPAALALAKAAAAATFVSGELQPHLARAPEVQAAQGILQNLRVQVETLSARLAGFDGSLERLNRFPNSLIREEERRDFAAFLAVCRGGVVLDRVTGSVDPDEETSDADAEGETGVPEPLTLACLEGWQAQMDADRENLWQTLAQQVPPGILLLFLLATLGGLYRYNMRMAGFHHSRADALEAMGLGFAKEDWDEAIRLADALAADKVEFGKGNAPSDQAVEIAKTIVSRGGP